MTYQSVDALQRTLADTVFAYTSDRKKAAGRALGTLVELITFYALRSWDMRDHMVIEKKVPEFANPEILHNVEFSLHRILSKYSLQTTTMTLPLTAAKLKRAMPSLQQEKLKATQLLSSGGVKRNACVIMENDSRILVANLDLFQEEGQHVTLCVLDPAPFAIFECKRVGVEEGMRKGPQTIEKAKQGAYVARTVSSLQKVRLRDGQFQGLVEQDDGTFISGPYLSVLRELIHSSQQPPSGLMLTVGIVSNHGNWFTSNDPNKELRVLAQSYDWLLFLTDTGLSNFINTLLLNPVPELEVVRKAFLDSYTGASGANKFTKVQIDVNADTALWDYFSAHKKEIQSWFNVIAPAGYNIGALRADLLQLAHR